MLDELGLFFVSRSLYRTPDGTALDIHGSIPGLRLGGGDSAGLSELRASGRIEPWRPGLHHVHRLDRPTRVAVTVVHALAHHGPEPSSYRLLLAIADLIDEGVSSQEAEAIARLAAPDVPPGETRALIRLAEGLRSGDPTVFEPGAEASSPENILLRHFVSPLLGKDPDRARLDWLFYASTREPTGSSWLGRAFRVAFAKRPGEGWKERWVRPFRLAWVWGPRVLRAALRTRSGIRGRAAKVS